MVKKVLYAAAHSGFNLRQVPLGGGASVCQHLAEEWIKTKPFDLEVLGPSLLKEAAPQHKDLVRYSELEYARFCRRFERQLTERILQYDPKEVVVLCNDVSEGPDFKTLAAKGYALYTLYHVDVVDYFTTIYLRSWVRPEWTTALYRGMSRLGLWKVFPSVLKLIWEKQEASVRYSKGLIVPSHHMKDVLLRCYPELEPSRVHVLPWGSWEDPVSSQEVQQELEALRQDYPVPAGAWTLLTLSRISPEKGQDRLLKALAVWEKQSDYPKEGVCLLIAGESAYMMGEKYERKLKTLAAKLTRSRVYFVGYAAAAKKRALFNLSNVYVFPSIHESYGLTLLEALRAGLPVLTTPSHGAKEVFKPEFGEMITSSSESRIPGLLVESLNRLLSNRSLLHQMGASAAAWAQNQKFTDTAVKLADLLIRS